MDKQFMSMVLAGVTDKDTWRSLPCNENLSLGFYLIYNTVSS